MRSGLRSRYEKEFKIYWYISFPIGDKDILDNSTINSVIDDKSDIQELKWQMFPIWKRLYLGILSG